MITRVFCKSSNKEKHNLLSACNIAHAGQTNENSDAVWVGRGYSRHIRRLQALRSADTLKREKLHD